MKLQTLLITTFALTLSFSIAQENGMKSLPQSSVAPTVTTGENEVELIVQESGADPYKNESGVHHQAKPCPSAGVMSIEIIPGEAGQLGESQDKEWHQIVDPDHSPRPEVIQNPQLSNHETLSFCYEDFSLPMEMMAEIQQKQLTDAALYEYIRKSLGTDPENDPVRREIFVILRAKSGFPADAESLVTAANHDPKDTSRVGYRINLEYSDSDDINLRFRLENATVIGSGNVAADGKEVDRPLVNTENIQATVGLSLNVPYLIGTVNRAANSKLGSGSARRILLGFVTASHVK